VVGLSSRENRSTASELAERGFVTISPSYPLLANYQEPPSSRGFESGTMMAIWDNVRACDYLDTLGFVKRAGGYGAIGHSLGGHNAVWTALFEPRVTCVVSSCGLDSFRDYKGGDITGWTSNRCAYARLDGCPAMHLLSASHWSLLCRFEFDADCVQPSLRYAQAA
jgi:pimeloyl-ACP methyl ester carboxylesterase